MKNLATIILVTCGLPAAFVWSQETDDLAGASRPKPDMNLKRDWQYKRVHQLALRYILGDRAADAEAFLHDFLEAHEDDAESYFILGVLQAQQGELDESVAMLRKAIELGLPPERIVAGPRTLFEPLASHEFYRRLLDEYAAVPLHGPLVGHVTDHSASIWIRTAKASPVSVIVYDVENPQESHASEPVESTEGQDFTAVVNIDGLEPDTAYRYEIRIGDGSVQRQPLWRFRTFPTAGDPARFTIAFGGGAGYVPDNEHMWHTVATYHPLALLLLGDNVYIDDPESPEMQHYTYYRRQSRPEWRNLTAQTAVFTIWDDHDFSTNDSWGGPEIDRPNWKRNSVWPIFHQNWANPPYASGESQPGCWYRFGIGDVDFFMLDCRYYRTDPRTEQPSMLGPVQLEWLQDQLGQSTGTFKVICSSVPWDFRTKNDSLDTWNGYRDERETIFAFIEKERIEGVVLISADRHRSDAWRIERPGGYDLYEFNSSRLTNQHVHRTMEDAGALFSYNAKQSFGLVSFDTTAEDPTVTYDVITIDGETVRSLQVQRSRLGFPVGF